MKRYQVLALVTLLTALAASTITLQAAPLTQVGVIAPGCEETLVDESALPSAVLPAVDVVMAAIQKACPSLAECKIEDVRRMIELEIHDATPSAMPSQILSWLGTVAGRGTDIGLYVLSVFGSGLLAAYLLDGHHEIVRTSITAFVILNAELLFGQFNRPFLGPMEGYLRRLAFVLWNPKDRWGQIMRSASETTLYRNTQIMEMLLLLKLKRAGAYIRKGLSARDVKAHGKYMKAAGKRLAHAIAHGYEVFVKTNVDSAPLIRELRHELPDDWYARRATFLPELSREVLQSLRNFRPGVEIFPETDRDDLVFFGAAILRIWFQ